MNTYGNYNIEFDKEFNEALLKLERLKESNRKKRRQWLRKHNKLKDRFFVETNV